MNMGAMASIFASLASLRRRRSEAKNAPQLKKPGVELQTKQANAGPWEFHKECSECDNHVNLYSMMANAPCQECGAGWKVGTFSYREINGGWERRGTR